jgi:hypothetical protein
MHLRRQQSIDSDTVTSPAAWAACNTWIVPCCLQAQCVTIVWHESGFLTWQPAPAHRFIMTVKSISEGPCRQLARTKTSTRALRKATTL